MMVKHLVAPPILSTPKMAHSHPVCLIRLAITSAICIKVRTIGKGKAHVLLHNLADPCVKLLCSSLFCLLQVGDFSVLLLPDYQAAATLAAALQRQSFGKKRKLLNSVSLL